MEGEKYKDTYEAARVREPSLHSVREKVLDDTRMEV
jgi:hypothetical protein